MTGCEIVVVFTLLTQGGKPSAIRAQPVMRGRCATTRLRFETTGPVERRYPLCPVLRRG